MADRGDIDRIRELLLLHPKGLTIEEVAQELGINRSTASKYLNSLVFSGAATIRKLGPAKLFYLREHLPLKHLINCTNDCILILDSDMVIQEINENALLLFDTAPEKIMGFQALHTPLAPLFDEDTCQLLKSLPESSGAESTGRLTLGCITWKLTKKIVPLVFQSGNFGAGIIFRVARVAETASDTPQHPQEGIDPMYARACRQSSQLNTLFRRFSQNQLSLAIDSLKKMRQAGNPGMLRELLDEEALILENLRFHLNLLEEYLGEEIRAPGWYSLEDILSRALPLQKMAHIRFFSDVRGIEVFTDRDCGRIFSTLLENSIIHGKKVTSIRVISREKDGDLSITYEDDGIGIPDKDKPSLFEWGHGIHKAHSLFLSRQMLAITDISIKETGTFGKGARFELSVPAVRWRIKKDRKV